MFNGASSFNGDISHWDVSQVTDMYYMFYTATAFDQDLRFWDVSSVTDMYAMFSGASSFDGAISDWDVSSVTEMLGMFYEASSFNQDLSSWCVSQITTAPGSFDTSATAWTESRPVWGTCPATTDIDGDGSTANVDCDDNDSSVYPGATEIADDGIDQDCDGGDLVTIETSCADGVDDDVDGSVDCDDSDCANDAACATQLTYTNHAYPLFQSYGCTGCHSSQFASYSDLISVQAGDYNSSSAGAGMPWITANDSSQSYLYHKIAGTHSTVSGAGNQMPNGGPYMSAADLRVIEDWIDGGAAQ